MNLKKLIVIILILSLSSCKVSRFVVYNFADIKDYKKFPKREIQNTSNEVFKFKNSPSPLKIDEDFLKKNKTVAFLVIQNDTIKYENYFNNYNKSSIVTSFSMAKSMISILIGCAIEDGYITSVNEPVTNYIPELIDNNFDTVTIENLLQMTSGLKFNESYFNPFGHAASFYYGRNLRKAVLKLKLNTSPGTDFNYKSGNAQILGLILDRALKGKTISSYLEEKIWSPLHMEYDASWSIDKKKDGIEKTFCCINARAIDFAKIGRLYLNNGKWGNKQIINEEWVKTSTKIDSLKGSSKGYQYQWWLNEFGDFNARGILGQYIYVSPEKNLIIVRLGKKYGNTNWDEEFLKIKNRL